MLQRIADFARGIRVPRSPQWTTFRKNHLKIEPKCRWCGGTLHLDVHHIEPFHICPKKELDENNVITLCRIRRRFCHFIRGHFGDWKKFNPDIKQQCAERQKEFAPDGAFLCITPVQVWYLHIIGKILSLGAAPVHCRLYWRKDGQCWMTELTNDIPGQTTEIVGVGDGYTIQTSKAIDTIGVYIPCNIDKIDGFTRAYGSTVNGRLTNGCDWFNEPRGYGGPMYDKNTSNTYVTWLIQKCGGQLPPKPRGAIGWGRDPKFPGPEIN